MSWKKVGAIFDIFWAAQTVPALSTSFVRRRESVSPERQEWYQVARAERQTKEALSLAQAKSELLAAVSHELRSPLTSILGVAEMLDYGVYGPLSREQKDAVKLVSECTQHMARLINDLLEQSRLERGAFHLEESKFVLDDVVQRLRRQMAPTAREKGLRLAIKVAPEMPEVLYGDPLRLYQVVQNLVDNSIKYTDSGQVAVLFMRIDAKSFTVQVSDTGVGIPTDKLSAIFDPYRRLSSSGKESDSVQKSGFGLGLSIVKQLVSLMDGSIQVSSQVGQGSVFTVKFPIREEAEKSA